MNKPTVWIVQSPGPKFVADTVALASNWGPSRFVYEGFEDLSKTGLRDAMLNLWEFKEGDYLLLTGNRMLCAMALLALSRRKHPVQILYWHGLDREYRLLTLSMEDCNGEG